MIIRRLGSQILRVAIRRSGPELRGWGTAMLNEMDAIENDWAALRWAIGGAASLFRGFELPISDALRFRSDSRGYKTRYVVRTSWVTSPAFS